MGEIERTTSAYLVATVIAKAEIAGLTATKAADIGTLWLLAFSESTTKNSWPREHRIRMDRDGQFYVIDIQHSWQLKPLMSAGTIGPFDTWEEALATLRLKEIPDGSL